MPKLIGQEINANFFRAYMKNTFGESFAHCSLSFEKVFNESKESQMKLNKFIEGDNVKYAEKIDKENYELLGKRFQEVIEVLKYMGIPENQTYDENGDAIPNVYTFSQYIAGAIRPYRNKKEYEEAVLRNELTGEKYESETLVEKAIELGQIILSKVKADVDARNLKKGNNEAFLYALELDKIGIPEIININYLVNNNAGISKGFKKINNEIYGTNFKSCSKELTPLKMQELLYKYNNEWREMLPKYKLGDSEEKKDEYLKAICERIAKFHIEFEKIHPFEDGNGRTGRIIMNKQLIDNELGPILITNEMRDIYIECINTNNYSLLGNLIYMISSITTPQIFAAYRKARGIDPSELELIKKNKTKLQTNKLI